MIVNFSTSISTRGSFITFYDNHENVIMDKHYGDKSDIDKSEFTIDIINDAIVILDRDEMDERFGPVDHGIMRLSDHDIGEMSGSVLGDLRDEIEYLSRDIEGLELKRWKDVRPTPIYRYLDYMRIMNYSPHI